MSLSDVTPGQLLAIGIPVHPLSSPASKTMRKTSEMDLIFILFGNRALELVGHQGTGSYPPGLKGLQRTMRKMAITDPLIAPYLYTA